MVPDRQFNPEIAMQNTSTLKHLEHHRPAVVAVARDKDGFPRASDRALHAARDAGLITFEAFPAGHWSVTALGTALLSSPEAHSDG